ncbi:hypothetical protein [uncultured Faecalibaculum sp.]|uniref:hypothetical protein n=2 Tax=uncultured Faecalibaculum sp. TaxID=1729681 RepID=UPI0025E3327B|nr:hypothetical protein [uncultured Faecalibaculum sp.]
MTFYAVCMAAAAFCILVFLCRRRKWISWPWMVLAIVIEVYAWLISTGFSPASWTGIISFSLWILGIIVPWFQARRPAAAVWCILDLVSMPVLICLSLSYIGTAPGASILTYLKHTGLSTGALLMTATMFGTCALYLMNAVAFICIQKRPVVHG